MDWGLKLSEDFENEKNEIIEGLQTLGFTLNDSKVYFTLLTLGKSNPASISEASGVDRARVYDSLKRLTKNKIVDEEPVKRAPAYKAIPPKIIFSTLRNEYSQKISLTKNLEIKLEEFKAPIKEPSVWSINGEQNISKAMDKLIDEAEEKISIILTPDISSENNRFHYLVNNLLSKKQKNKDIEIELAFNVQEHHTHEVSNLIHHDINIYHWSSGTILPFGLFVMENSFILTILIGVKGVPEYDFGITMENATEEMMAGFDHLASWCYAHLCKRVGIKRKVETEE